MSRGGEVWVRDWIRLTSVLSMNNGARHQKCRSKYLAVKVEAVELSAIHSWDPFMIPYKFLLFFFSFFLILFTQSVESHYRQAIH